MTQETKGKAVAKRDTSVFDPFRAMDMLDDQAIIAELEGRVIDQWVYHFPQEGREIWGLSKVGVDQACREMALQGEVVREEDVVYQVDPTDNRFVLFKAYASRIAVNKDGSEVYLDRTVGTKKQCIFIETRQEGITTRTNSFWFEQGSMKALRNARIRLITEEVRVKIITVAKTTNKVTRVKDKEEPKQKPKAQAEPEASPDASQSNSRLVQDESSGMTPTQELLSKVAEAKGWKNTKPVRSWLVNGPCKVKEERIDREPDKVWDEVSLLL